MLEYRERTDGLLGSDASRHYGRQLALLEDYARKPTVHHRQHQQHQQQTPGVLASGGAADDGRGSERRAAQGRHLLQATHTVHGGVASAEESPEESLPSPVRSEESVDFASSAGSRHGYRRAGSRARSEPGGGRAPDEASTSGDDAGDLSADEEVEL